MIKVVCGSAMIDAPWTPISFGILRLGSPPPSPSITAIDVSLGVPLLMEAMFAVAPRHERHHIPHTEASLGDGELGIESRIVSKSPNQTPRPPYRWSVGG